MAKVFDVKTKFISQFSSVFVTENKTLAAKTFLDLIFKSQANLLDHGKYPNTNALYNYGSLPMGLILRAYIVSIVGDNPRGLSVIMLSVVAPITPPHNPKFGSKKVL